MDKGKRATTLIELVTQSYFSRMWCNSNTPCLGQDLLFKGGIMSKRLTQEEVEQRIKSTFIQPVEVGQYINKRTPIHLKCLVCNFEWDAVTASVLYRNNHMCPNCTRTGEKVKCAYCGKEIYRTRGEIDSNKTGYFYCTHDCGNRHKNLLRKENGEWDKTKNYRKKALDNYEHKCFVCGWDEDERILEVHHVDENREHNELENLRILCPICHRKITLGYYSLDIENNCLILKDQ